MNVQRLIEDAQADGVIIEVDGDDLRIRDAKNKGHWIKELGAHSKEVLWVLRGGTAGDPKLSMDDWEDPQPLSEPLPSVDPYTPDLLPPDVQDAVIDISERMQCPPDFVAAAMLVAMASVAGRRVTIRPRQFDSWTVVPNLWGYVVGRPSLKKSPAVSEPMKQVRRIERREKAKMAREIENAKIEARMIPEELKILRARLQSELKKGGGRSNPEVPVIAEQIRDLEESQPPAPRRIITSDVTIEKLGELLENHPLGILLFVDELLGWVGRLDRKDQSGVRDNYLTLWTGNDKLNIDRIGRGETVVESPFLCVFGCCTPGRLSEYVGHAMRGGRGDDGFVQRLQVAVWPDSPRNYTLIDRRPDDNAISRLEQVFDRLADLDPGTIGQVDPQSSIDLPYVRFSPDAQQVFDRWDVEHNQRLRVSELPEAIESHLGKYASLMPSIALILHLAMGDAGPVSLKAAEKAVRWVKYLESHAMRVYAFAVAGERQYAVKLLERLINWKGDEPIRVRAIGEKGWQGLDSKEAIEAALDVLVDTGWIRSQDHKPKQGRPTKNYQVHPRASEILSEHKKGPRKTPETPDGSTVDGSDGNGTPDPDPDQTDGVVAGEQSEVEDQVATCELPF